MKLKTIDYVFNPPAPHMVGDGFYVHNFFPNGNRLGIKRMSPFFLLDYNAKMYLPPSDTPRGVGVHPHRGFETVTIAYHGKVAHHDSAGNAGVIGEGEVQWMSAAAGILHKEYHEAGFTKQGGDFQMVQLWVNLPAQFKMSKPKYQALDRNNIRSVELPDNAGKIEVIAGELDGVAGAAATYSPMEVYNVHLNAGKTTAFELPETYNTGVLVVQGSVTVNGEKAAADQFVLFRNTGTRVEIAADDDAVLLVLSGEPINEPIVAYGPFLMNTQEEIRQAFDDYNHGGFGYLD